MISFLGKSQSSADDSSLKTHKEEICHAHQPGSQTWILPQRLMWWWHKPPASVISACNCAPAVLLRESQGLPFPPGFVSQDLVHKYYKCLTLWDGLPRWLVVKNLPAMQESWLGTPGLGRSCREGNGNPLQNSYLENPMDKKSCVGYSPWGSKSRTQISN